MNSRYYFVFFVVIKNKSGEFDSNKLEFGSFQLDSGSFFRMHRNRWYSRTHFRRKWATRM